MVHRSATVTMVAVAAVVVAPVAVIVVVPVAVAVIVAVVVAVIVVVIVAVGLALVRRVVDVRVPVARLAVAVDGCGCLMMVLVRSALQVVVVRVVPRDLLVMAAVGKNVAHDGRAHRDKGRE